MNLLAVDTSTTSCSVALFSDHRLLAEVVYTAGKTHSRHLLAIIHEILSRCDCEPADVGGIAVTRGPGTFTGLRIGISTVKGLAVATGTPVVGVSSLAALAYPLAMMKRPVVAMIDARRGEVYHAIYNADTGVLESTTPVAVSPPETVAEKLPSNAILVGSGAVLYREVFQNRGVQVRFAEATAQVIRAASVGMLAMARFERQESDPIDTLVPEYIRKSDAQIQMPANC